MPGLSIGITQNLINPGAVLYFLIKHNGWKLYTLINETGFSNDGIKKFSFYVCTSSFYFKEFIFLV